MRRVALAVLLVLRLLPGVALRGDGSTRTTFDSSPGGGEAVDKSKVLNLFENPIVADLDGLPGLEVMRGGLTLNGLVNLGIAVGQNLPYNHVVQAWNGATGQSLPAYRGRRRELGPAGAGLPWGRAARADGGRAAGGA
jgi:hypothetical protein